ncbi:MAG: hypothetical protein WEB78_12760 [Ilumatobacteraceae bacterium]
MSDAEETDEVISKKGLGPLGPWRLAIAIGTSAAFTGMPLVDAATTGVDIDMALLRSLGVAFLTWISVGALNKALFDIPPAAAGRTKDSAQEVHQ